MAAVLMGLLLPVALVADAATPAPEIVHYTLTPRLDTGGIRVEMAWETRGRSRSAVYLAPRWGNIADVPALLRGLEFGGGVSGVRRKGSRWLLRHARGATVTCRYEIEAGRRRLDWDGPYYAVTTRSFFHGVGNAFLLTPEAGRGLPERYDVTLRWELPPGWKAVCSWGRGRHIGAQMVPEDLRQSVYLAGQIVTRTVERGGVRATVALRDRFAFSLDEFAEMAATIVVDECRFMNESEFPPFLITAVPVGPAINPGDSRLTGMGLYQSFMLLAAPNSTLTDGFAGLFAHELFHYWNGRVLRAAPPEKRAYWFVEGFTEYYALRILRESGYWPVETYAKWINRHLRRYYNNPAIHATNEEIAAHYWDQRDTVGEIPYQRGVLLGLRWHRLARDHGVADGVDRLLRALVARARRGGFEMTNEIIRQVGVQELGAWFGPEFDRYVVAAETIDVPRDALAPELVGRYEQVYEYELGFDAQRAAREKRVFQLRPGSAAARAGLREGDRLVAAKVHADPDRQIELKVRREGKVRTIRYFPRGRRTLVLQFSPAGG